MSILTTISTEAFLDRALPRIRLMMLILGAGGTLVCLIFFRWQVAAGFLVGAIVSYFNQHFLGRAIEALGERVAQQQSRERGEGIVVRAVLRNVLIAAGAYVIFNVSHAGLYGFLGGVCLPIAAIACEVAAEVFIMRRHGN